jgi:hypothetical protein
MMQKCNDLSEWISSLAANLRSVPWAMHANKLQLHLETTNAKIGLVGT